MQIEVEMDIMLPCELSCCLSAGTGSHFRSR